MHLEKQEQVSPQWTQSQSSCWGTGLVEISEKYFTTGFEWSNADCISTARFDKSIKATRIWFTVAKNGIQVDIILCLHSFSCHISCLAISISVYCWSGFLCFFSQSIMSAYEFVNWCIQPRRTTFVSACMPAWYIFLNSRKESVLELSPVHLYWICIWIGQKNCTGSRLDQHVVGRSHLYCKGRICVVECAWRLALVVR